MAHGSRYTKIVGGERHVTGVGIKETSDTGDPAVGIVTRIGYGGKTGVGEQCNEKTGGETKGEGVHGEESVWAKRADPLCER